MIFPDLEICGIYSQERIRAVQRSGPECLYIFVEVLAKVRNCRLGEARPANLLDNFLDLTGRNTVDDHLSHAGNESRLAARIILEDHGFERSVPMTRNSKNNRADTQSKRTLTSPIATAFALFRAFIGLDTKLFGGLCQKRTLFRHA